jgi:phosphomannomutase / phosphoglucomutase
MSIYKECDIRGLYGKDLDNDKANLIGKSIGTILQGSTVIVGGDARNSTEELKNQLIDGLISCGCQVIDLGTIPTPVFYFGKKLLNADGGVMVTASHNPAEYNGFKISLGSKPVEPGDIMKIGILVSEGVFLSGDGSLVKRDIKQEYIDYLKGFLSKHKPLKVVIDCCNGAASDIAPRIFTELGHEVVRLYCSFDGSFPNRNPNPSVEENLDDLKARVLYEQADLGIAFDGDGDRAVFIDDAGRFCQGEKSFVILLEHYLKGNVSTVVYDGKSSSIVKKTVEKLGSRSVMERSGHAFIKRTFLETDSILAGEVSGHFFFRELGCDDGIYASLKIAEIIGAADRSMSDLIDNIEQTVISPDIRISMSSERADRIIENLAGLGSDYELSFLDGVRIEFPRAWILVRKSVTEPCITIRLEADTIREVERISRQIFADEYTDIHQIISNTLDFII